MTQRCLVRQEVLPLPFRRENSGRDTGSVVAPPHVTTLCTSHSALRHPWTTLLWSCLFSTHPVRSLKQAIATDEHCQSDYSHCIVRERLPPPSSQSGYYCMWVLCSARTPSSWCLLPTQGWVPSSYHSYQGAFFNASFFNKCLSGVTTEYLCLWNWSYGKNLKRIGWIFFPFFPKGQKDCSDEIGSG